MFDDMISEVCAEIELLSAYVSKFELTEIGSPQGDEALLLSGLSLLSAQAQKIKDGKVAPIAQYGQTHVIPYFSAPVLQTPSAANPSVCDPHKWVFEVLNDLVTYTRENNLHSVARKLEFICANTCHRNSETESFEVVGGFQGYENVVEFEPR